MTNRMEIMSNFDIKLNVLEAMEKLMEHTPLDKLTVAKISAAANISHATFYRYFKDKHAVAQWYLNYSQSLGVDKIGRTCSWQKGYYMTEMAVLEHIDFFRRVAKSNDYNAVDNYSPRHRRETLVETIVDYHHIELTERMRFDIDATVVMETYLFPRWHYGEYDVTLDEVSRWMADSVPKQLFEALNTPVKLSTIRKA